MAEDPIFQLGPARSKRYTPPKRREKGPSGLLGRLGAVATGLGGAVQAPFGLVKDIAWFPGWDDDEFDGITGTLFGATKSRGGQFLGSAFGRNEGLGAAIGAIPASVRERVGNTLEGAAAGAAVGGGAGSFFAGIGAIPGAIGGAVVGGAYGGVSNRDSFEDLETVGREGIREPLSTAFTAGSLAQAEGGIAALFEGDTWREAYRIAQDRSLGQSFALMFLTDDVTDDQQLARAVGSDAFKVMSATADGMARLFLEPDVVGGKLLKAGRTGGRLIVRNADDINGIARSPGFAQFIDNLEGKSAAEIRNQFFPHHSHGGAIADALAFDADPLVKRTTARALMGDRPAKEALLADRPALAARIDRLTAERSRLHEFAEDSMFSDPKRLGDLDAEIKALYPEADRLAALDALTDQAPLREVPRANAGAWRSAITRSAFYQESAYAAPLRATFNMVPNRWVNLHANNGDVHLLRNLQGAGMPLEFQDEWRNAYLSARNPLQRQNVLARAEDAAVTRIAKEAGLDEDELQELVSSLSTGRQRAMDVIASRSYDGKGRSRVRFQDDDLTWHEVNLPLFITQEANFHTMVDLDKVRRAATRVGQFKARHPSTQVPKELMAGFHRAWKPTVLLRAGWPIRVVMDEQLRMMAKIGTLAAMKNLAGATPELGDRMVSAFGRRLTGAQRFSREALDARSASRFGSWTHKGYEMQGAFGTPADAAWLYRTLNSSSSDFDELLGVTEDGILSRLRERTGSFGGSVTPDMPEFGPSWERAVNLQFGQDVVGRRLLRGDSIEEVTQWLRSTPQGQAAARRFSFRAGDDPTEWVRTMSEVIDDYTLGNPTLRHKAILGTAKADDLRKVQSDLGGMVVHGELVAQLTGSGVIKSWADTTIGQAFKALGQTPTDVLSRNPFFSHLYQAEAKRLVNIAAEQFPEGLAEAQIRQIENSAREYALRESKELLYDLAEDSRLSEMASFFMPFYSAWQEVATRWAGLAWESPDFVAQLRQVWQAPDRAGVVVDERGWETKDGRAKNPLTGEWVAPKGDPYIVLGLPGWATENIPGLKSLGEMVISKKSANLLLQGPPGFSPVVAIAVNEIAKERPDLEESLKFILPFGVTNDTKEMIMSATMKRGKTLMEGEDNVQYANARNRMYLTQLVEYNLGLRKEKPTWESAGKATDAQYKLRTFLSWTAPVSITFNSPYQPYIEVYRAAQERFKDEPAPLGRHPDGEPIQADEWFFDRYGEEFYALTVSLSKSNDGIPPTQEGIAFRKEFRDLIEDPDLAGLGGLIIGKEGAGEYSNFAYQSQLSNRIRPGSGTRQRDPRSLEEVAAAPDIGAAWIKYGRFMDLIEAERINRGLPNLQVKAASDLAEAKRQFTAKLEADYPAWADARQPPNLNAAKKRLAGMRKIANDQRLAGRDEFVGLREYLDARDLVTAELDRRKAKTLTAVSNQDLAQAWESIKGALIEKNLAFGDLFYRWLENDDLGVR